MVTRPRIIHPKNLSLPNAGSAHELNRASNTLSLTQNSHQAPLLRNGSFSDEEPKLLQLKVVS
jgi:hypothetical protein